MPNPASLAGDDNSAARYSMPVRLYPPTDAGFATHPLMSLRVEPRLSVAGMWRSIRLLVWCVHRRKGPAKKGGWIRLGVAPRRPTRLRLKPEGPRKKLARVPHCHRDSALGRRWDCPHMSSSYCDSSKGMSPSMVFDGGLSAGSSSVAFRSRNLIGGGRARAIVRGILWPGGHGASESIAGDLTRRGVPALTGMNLPGGREPRVGEHCPERSGTGPGDHGAY